MLFLRTGWLVLAMLYIAGASASLLDDILEAFERAVDCVSCHSLLVSLQALADLGDTLFSDTLTTICQTVKVADKDVCQGLISQQGPILAHDLRCISPFRQTATKLCNSLLGLCDDPAVNPHSVVFPKPLPENPSKFVSSGKPPIQVVHFSDVHIDRMYTTGSEVNCTKPICCRDFADETGSINVPAGPIASHNCDTSSTLAQSMLEAVSSQKPRFSIFTGDVVEAAVWLVNQSEVTKDLETFNDEMARYLASPVFPVIGNHEAAPVNNFPRSTTSSGSQWVFDTQSQGWMRWIHETAAKQVQHISGSYSVNAPGTNLRIISLNDIYWYRENFWLYDSDTLQPDPNGILAFAIDQLQAAEDLGQRAWIIAHMPPGGPDALHDQDEFVLSYSDYTNQTVDSVVNIGWIAPSLTPRSANPAFKIYDIDPDTYEVMDARAFISDMADPSFQKRPLWKVEYSARDVYGAAIGGWPATESLNPAFWHIVTEAFAKNDTIFQLYNSFKNRGFNTTVCDEDCRKETICNLRAMRAENNCHIVTPVLDYRKRSLSTGSQMERCEGPGLGHIISWIADNIVETDKDLLRKKT